MGCVAPRSLASQSKATDIRNLGRDAINIVAEAIHASTLIVPSSSLYITFTPQRNMTSASLEQTAENLKNEGNALFGSRDMYFSPMHLSHPIQERRNSEIFRSHSTHPNFALVQQSRCRIREAGTTRCRINRCTRVCSPRLRI